MTHDDDPFDDIFAQMDEFVRRMQEDLFGELDEGWMGGYSVTRRPGEEPEVHRFGDAANGPAGPGDAAAPGGADGVRGGSTHVEVHDEDDEVRVVGDLPGVAKEDIDLSATEERLRIAAANDSRSYDETVRLPARVDPDSATASFNNGVLEVTFAKTTDANAKDIDIE